MKPALAWNGRGRDKTKGLRSAPKRTQNNAPLLRAHTALDDPRSPIPKFIFPGATGRELPQHGPAALANTLERLLNDCALGQRLASEARGLIEQSFDIHRNTAMLRALFGVPDPARIEAVGGGR